MVALSQGLIMVLASFPEITIAMAWAWRYPTSRIIPGEVVKRGGQGISGGRAKRPKTQHDAYDDLDGIENFDIIKKKEDDEDKKVIFLDKA
ncbi:uncharacterized protein PG986_010516 [Apiospora aurea]|uniref:Uncharacterized protein n=1 Tax=Apiospora aurea TaxID=335848 RepID=A0ABR1Q2K5_9PEZI